MWLDYGVFRSCSTLGCSTCVTTLEPPWCEVGRSVSVCRCVLRRGVLLHMNFLGIFLNDLWRWWWWMCLCRYLYRALLKYEIKEVLHNGFFYIYIHKILLFRWFYAVCKSVKFYLVLSVREWCKSPWLDAGRGRAIVRKHQGPALVHMWSDLPESVFTSKVTAWKTGWIDFWKIKDKLTYTGAIVSTSGQQRAVVSTT